MTIITLVNRKSGLFLFDIEGREVHPVMNCEDADQDHGKERQNVRDGHCAAEGAQDVVEHTAHYAGDCIDILAENQRHLIDEHVAEHTAGRARDASHKDIHPIGESGRHTLFQPHYGEQSESDCIENEERCVEIDHLLAENDGEYYGEDRNDDIGRLHHPERGHSKAEVPQRSAAHSGHESHDGGTEQIELLGCGQSHAAYRKCESTKVIEYGNKVQLHKSEKVTN